MKARLEALYGSNDEEFDESTPPVLGSWNVSLVSFFDGLNDMFLIAAHRILCSKNTKEKLKAQLSEPMESLLNFPLPPAPSAPPRKSRRRRASSNAISTSRPKKTQRPNG